MKNLLSLLERFSRSLNQDTSTKTNITKTILERTGVKLILETLALKDGLLEINASPAAKNEIKLKEEAIKAELKERYQIQITRILYK